MSDDALQRLEAMRARRVDEARAQLHAAEASERAQAEVRRAGHAEELALGRAIQEARSAFASARDVLALRAAEVALAELQQRLHSARARAQRAQLAEHQAAAAVALQRSELRERELARRVVQRGRERRTADVSLRTERRLEDERDDQFRGQTRREPGPGGSSL